MAGTWETWACANFRLLLLPAVLLLLATLVWADDTPNYGWLQRLVNPALSSPKKLPAPADDDDADEAIPPRKTVKVVSRQTPPVPRNPVDVRVQAQAAYHRRVAACVRLREIADETNDEALRQKVERLEERIWNVYSRQTGNVRAKVGGKGS